MVQSLKQQVMNGVRLSFGILAFIAGCGLTMGGIKLLSSGPQIRALACLVGGVLILLASSPVWYLYFAGCAVLGSLKCLYVIIAGTTVYDHRPSDRLESLQVFFFCIAVVWFSSLVVGKRHTILDRIVLTMSVVSLLGAAASTHKFSLLQPLQVATVGTLLLAWARHRHAQLRTSDSVQTDR
jgi:hypothetical protein